MTEISDEPRIIISSDNLQIIKISANRRITESSKSKFELEKNRGCESAIGLVRDQTTSFRVIVIDLYIVKIVTGAVDRTRS